MNVKALRRSWRSKRWLRIAVVAVAGILLMELYVFCYVDVMFSIEPGGRDVRVTVDDKQIRPTYASPEGNLYTFWLRYGTYLVQVEKPGFLPQRQILRLEAGTGEAYPVFPRLRRIAAPTAPPQLPTGTQAPGRRRL